MNKLQISQNCDKKIFRKFLLKLSKTTINNFTHFGNISPKNVNKIISSELKNDNKIRFFTYLGDDLIAYSFLLKFTRHSKKHVCSYGIVMGDKWQGRGFGYEICKYMIDFAWKNKFEKVWLTSYFDNKPAWKIYKKLGFEVEGIFVNEEKINGKPRHVVSMGLFRNKKNVKKFRETLFKKLN